MAESSLNPQPVTVAAPPEMSSEASPETSAEASSAVLVGGFSGTTAAAAKTPWRHRPWNDAPLRSKVGVILALALIAGVALGLLEAHFGHRRWVLLLGMLGALLVLWPLGRYLICQPMEQLLEAWDRLAYQRGPGALKRLPVSRADEVGHLARALHQLAGSAIREGYEARTLRRTLDARIANATRRATGQLLRMVMRDPLTDLGNRRFLQENLEPLVQSVLASGASLAAVALDCDNFKPVNDKLGHATGDELLVCLAELLRASIRQEDYAVRLGGDEFVVLLPDCSRQRVQEFTDRLRKLFRQRAAGIVGGNLAVDLSMGVAYLPGDGVRNGTELLQRADENLYAAKHAGKGVTVGA